MTNRAAVERHWPQLGASGPRALSSLRMAFGNEGAYAKTSSEKLYQINRTLSFKVENIGVRSLSSVKIAVESVDCKTGLVFPLVLREGIDLAPGEEVFVPLVRYGEAADPKKFNCADSFATMVLPVEKPFFDVEEGAQVCLRVTGQDPLPYYAKCRVYVDQGGRLGILREW